MRRLRTGLIGALAGATLLAGCDLPTGGVKSSPTPPDRPEVEASALSQELVGYYARLQNSLLTQGLLRTDGGGPDATFSERDLVRNFMRIALYEEYADAGGHLIARQNASTLHRWDKGVTISVEFGPSATPEMRDHDTEELRSYAQRIARVTGHPVSTPPSGGNFRVFIVNEDERRALGARLRAFIPGISQTALNTVLNLERSTYCLAFAVDPEHDGTYSKAVAIIRAEHPDLLRTSCIHEEIAQGFGLSNDYPLARPSIFNDDEEFGLLTHHDELLLQMLYDPRLRPGMTEDEARPIVEQIAHELMGGEV